MSKINQIQNKLLEIDGGSFQKLCDAYLYKKGYENINPIGSLIGSDKVKKGTPDTLIPLPNGQYVFAEYTTQQQGIFKKIKGDLEKCFNISNSGVPLDKIEEVIFCHTSELTPDQCDTLSEDCQEKQVNLRVFGIGALSYDLYLKYSGLARDFLGIEVDTGQILTQDEFISAYEKNKLASPLSTVFRFREDELSQINIALEEGNLIILLGCAGVGKSRLALECCKRFTAAHTEFQVTCIFSRGLDVFEDIKTHFSEPGNYLIFVDDANRISRFEYVVQMLQHHSENVHIKILATVRDYAANKVREIARPYGRGLELELNPFEDEQIRELVKEEYGIKNPYYLDRITSIAKGNPRLAIMAAQVASREDKLSSISDVTALYDEYYRSIQQDLKDLDSPSFLKVSCLVTFFGAVDRTNRNLMNSIEQVFDIDPDDFWECATQLHELEILDMYENEVVRVSDQVLGTYLFYLAFFRRKCLNFSSLLSNFFPEHRSRIIDAIHPVLNAFDSRKIMDAIRPHVDKVWTEFEQRNDEQCLLHLMSAFWYVKETEILVRIKEWIDSMEVKQLDPKTLDFKTDSAVYPPSILDVLSSLRNSSDRTLRVVVALLLDYIARRPDELPKVMHILIETFGFDHTDTLYGFAVQREVVDVLWDRASKGDVLYAYVFLAVAERYLHTRFTTMRSTSKRVVAITKFDLPSTPEVTAIRKSIWNGVFSLYENKDFEERAPAVLRHYSRSPYEVSVRNIIAEDAVEVVKFINSKLDPTIYLHCLVVQDYLRFLTECKVPFDEKLKDNFQNQTYRVSELLMEDYASNARVANNYEDFRESKKRHIGEFCSSYKLADYQRLIEQCQEIKEQLQGGHNDYELQDGLTLTFLELSERNADLFVQVLSYYLEQNDPLNIQPFPLVRRLVQVRGPNDAYEILNACKGSIQGWLSSFFQCLTVDQVTEEHVDRLCDVYQKADPSALPYGMDFLLNYRNVDEHVFPRVTNIILARSKKEPNCVYALSLLLNPYSETNKNLKDLFRDGLDVLKAAYIAITMTDRHDDHDGSTFARILNLDPDFIFEYIDAVYQRGRQPSRYDDTRDYTFLWEREDHMNIMPRVIDRIYELEKKLDTLFHSYLEAFFRLKESNKPQELIKKRQNDVLIAIIKRSHKDLELMKFLFILIAEFAPARRRQLLALFLEYNKSYEIFKKLDLEPRHWSWSGSAVPVFQGRVEYLESLLPLLDNVDFLKHRHLVEQRIQCLRSEIERQKKRDFIDD